MSKPVTHSGARFRQCLVAVSIALLAGTAATGAAPAPPKTRAGPNFLVRNGKARHVVTTKSGLEYYVLRSGPKTGAHPVDGDDVTFHYEGRLTTGEKFDSSFDRGEPVTGGVGAFVPGFTEALKLMRPGDEWLVWIPPELGYGSETTGPIPGNSVLKFRLKLIAVSTPPGDNSSAQ